jgi:hypothetical protein
MLAPRAFRRLCARPPLARHLWEPGDGAPQDWRSDRHWREQKRLFDVKEAKKALREGREPFPWVRAVAVAADVPLSSAPQFIRRKAQKVLASRERMALLKEKIAEKAALKDAKAAHAVLFAAAVQRKAEEDALRASVETTAAVETTDDAR